MGLVLCSLMPAGMAQSHTLVLSNALENHHTLTYTLLLVTPLEIWNNSGILQKKTKNQTNYFILANSDLFFVRFLSQLSLLQSTLGMGTICYLGGGILFSANASLHIFMWICVQSFVFNASNKRGICFPPCPISL